MVSAENGRFTRWDGKKRRCASQDAPWSFPRAFCSSFPFLQSLNWTFFVHVDSSDDMMILNQKKQQKICYFAVPVLTIILLIVNMTLPWKLVWLRKKSNWGPRTNGEVPQKGLGNLHCGCWGMYHRFSLSSRVKRVFFRLKNSVLKAYNTSKNNF